ncbi:hypothetical protein J1N35_018663 [Gossypium stocksii]|uniref:Uncharacterized protein n=1 Tax=Gossypium stocksii TaxID=47602 RepID=A0A9D4A7F5_9ROSI|nr:hypothetical protein J1N35_018663 [Gossypium stocksii]
MVPSFREYLCTISINRFSNCCEIIICGLFPHNWNIIYNPVTPSTSSSNQTNSHVASAGSSSHSQIAPISA